MMRTYLLMILGTLIVWPPPIVSWPLSPLDYDELPSTTEHNKDLYVVHAVVYEVGILTNATNSTEDDDPDKGEQIALTLYHKNGSDIDFSKIPTPLYTNITGQTVVGVVESPHLSNNDVLGNLSLHPEQRNIRSKDGTRIKRLACIDDETEDPDVDTTEIYTDESESSVEDFDDINKRSASKVIDSPKEILRNPRNSEENPPISQSIPPEDNKQWSVTQDIIAVPPQTSISSIALPPLISLNANLSHIPIPIPNASIVSYSSLSSHTKPVND